MTDKVRKTLEKYKMLERGDKVLVGLSGGADSTALLLSLIELGYDVRALHVNHNLRGEESMRDEKFCNELCKNFGIGFAVESVDVLKYCKENRCSIELGARELRYRALLRHADGCKIALAHNLSDCLETLIFNLVRGCGLHGLGSIPPVRDSIIRPLIDCTREEIEAYLKKKNQEYVTDSTNLEADCSRNIIRLNVIPELKKINPGLMSGFRSTIEAVREADRYLEEKASALSEKDVFSKDDPPAVLSRAIAIRLSHEGIEPSSIRINEIKDLIDRDGIINIKKGVYVKSSGGRITFEHKKGSEPEYKTDLRSNLELSGKTLILTKISSFDISCYQKRELKYLADESKISGEYIIRHVKGSETVRLPGRGFTSTVKKLLDINERAENYVIADSEGVVFVEGVGVSERICCTSDTASAVKIEFVNKEREK